MKDSWDEESRTEFLKWVHSKKATLTQRVSCMELLSILKNDILLHGPGLLIPHKNVQVKIYKGDFVALYSLKRNVDVEMCFACKDDQVHLVFIGQCDKSDNSWDIAIERTKRWNR